MKFYTNCQCIRSQIYLREVVNGKRVRRKVKYQPTLFLPSNDVSEKHKTLDGRPVSPMKFSSIREARDFVNSYKDVENFEIFGNTYYQYTFIGDEYSEHIDYDISKLIICMIDIEVASSQGFPNVENANEEVIAITMKLNDQYIVFGFRDDYVPKKDNISYFKCENEYELLSRFLDIWEKVSPDIITGWYIDDFDIPYLVNRIGRIFDEEQVKRLSPWGWIKERKSFFKGKERTTYDLVGISSLDYIYLYQKFAPKANQENYKLNTIAHVELDEKKISYDEYGNLYDLYLNHFEKFIDYNIKDVELIDKLEQKLKLIEMVVGVAYDAKVNYNDVFSQVRMWDTIIFNSLKKKGIVIPQKKSNVKKEQYAGAYVKIPKVGMHEWVVSFDLNSLYPHLIAQFNVSPEMIRPEFFKNVTVNGLLNQEYDLDYLKENNITLAANGHHFAISEEGFLPEILMNMYNLRKTYKKKMIQSQKDLEAIEIEMKKRGMELK